LDLPSSSRWKRAFSRRITEPSAGLAQAASTSAPTQSFKKVTCLPRSLSTSAATGLRVYFSFGVPFGRPRWEIRTTDLAPLSKAYLMVGKAATIRWLLEILPSRNGTLKSTLYYIIYKYNIINNKY